MTLRSALEFQTSATVGPSPLIINLDAQALAAACADSVIVFPAARQGATGKS